MKRNIFIILLLFFNSCSKDNNTEDTEVYRLFEAGIDGETISFTENLSSDVLNINHPDRRLKVFLYNNSKLVIKAFNLDTDQSITLVVGDAFDNEEINEGTYQVGNPNGLYPKTNIFYDDNDILGDNDEYYYSRNYGCHLTGSQVVGEIVIAKIDRGNKRITGTFKGGLFGWVYDESTISPIEHTASNLNISNGKFDLPYISYDDFKKDDNINKGIFRTKITHEDRDFTFLPTDGIVTGVGTRHFGVELRMNDSEKLIEFRMQVENENLGVIKMKVNDENEINIGETYNFRTGDLSSNSSIYFWDYFYISAFPSSPLPDEKNDSSFTLISLNKEEKIIEGTFEVNNSTRGVIMTEGYFKVKYDDL